MLDEQLEARRKLAEQEDRAAELAEKEAQLARISADPTRKKEELAQIPLLEVLPLLYLPYLLLHNVF